MVGLDAAGKTTILYKLKLGEIVTTIPTIGKYGSVFICLLFKYRYIYIYIYKCQYIQEMILCIKWYSLLNKYRKF